MPTFKVKGAYARVCRYLEILQDSEETGGCSVRLPGLPVEANTYPMVLQDRILQMIEMNLQQAIHLRRVLELIEMEQKKTAERAVLRAMQ